MLAPRVARWVEERGGPGESAIDVKRGVLTGPVPLFHPRAASAGVPASAVFFVSSSKLRAFYVDGRVKLPLESCSRVSAHRSPASRVVGASVRSCDRARLLSERARWRSPLRLSVSSRRGERRYPLRVGGDSVAHPSRTVRAAHVSVLVAAVTPAAPSRRSARCPASPSATARSRACARARRSRLSASVCPRRIGPDTSGQALCGCQCIQLHCQLTITDCNRSLPARLIH